MKILCAFWDAATNKVLALAGRSVLRDYVDVLYLHTRRLPLGALAWAAAGKDPGLTPEMIVEFCDRHSRFPGEDLSSLRLAQPVDFPALKLVFVQAREEAESLFRRLPPSEMGCLYLDATGQPVCPDPDSPSFASLLRHFGSVRGAGQESWKNSAPRKLGAGHNKGDFAPTFVSGIIPDSRRSPTPYTGAIRSETQRPRTAERCRMVARGERAKRATPGRRS